MNKVSTIIVTASFIIGLHIAVYYIPQWWAYKNLQWTINDVSADYIDARAEVERLTQEKEKLLEELSQAEDQDKYLSSYLNCLKTLSGYDITQCNESERIDIVSYKHYENYKYNNGTQYVYYDPEESKIKPELLFVVDLLVKKFPDVIITSTVRDKEWQKKQFNLTDEQMKQYEDAQAFTHADGKAIDIGLSTNNYKEIIDYLNDYGFASMHTGTAPHIHFQLSDSIDVYNPIASHIPDEFNSKGEMFSRVFKLPALSNTWDYKDRVKGFVLAHCSKGIRENWEHGYDYAISKGIDGGFLFAIAWADTSCGQNLTTKNNIGNVGNNDRGTRVGFDTVNQAMEAIIDTLTNSYIGQNKVIGGLSGGGRTEIKAQYDCSSAPMGYKCYATSEENWNKNVQRAFSIMTGMNVDGQLSFRKFNY
jgi:hypothetical protein